MPRRVNQRPVPGEPIGATNAWRAAVRAARSTCQCAGQCGRKHTRSGGTCDKQMTATSNVKLYATPRDGGGRAADGFL